MDLGYVTHNIMVVQPMMSVHTVTSSGDNDITHELRLATWNVRGLRQSRRRREIFASLERLAYDVVVLQETRFRACSGDGAAAQRDWSQGRALWSCSPDGLGGVGVLFRWESEVHLDSWADLWPGHLLYVDFTLRPGRGGGGSGPPPPQRHDQPCTRCRLLAVYAPVREAERRPLWARLRDFLGNSGRTVLVAGDFNNRARPEDRTGRMPRACLEAEEEDEVWRLRNHRSRTRKGSSCAAWSPRAWRTSAWRCPTPSTSIPPTAWMPTRPTTPDSTPRGASPTTIPGGRVGSTASTRRGGSGGPSAASWCSPLGPTTESSARACGRFRRPRRWPEWGGRGR